MTAKPTQVANLATLLYVPINSHMMDLFLLNNRQGGFATSRVGSPPLQGGSATPDWNIHSSTSILPTDKYDLSKCIII